MNRLQEIFYELNGPSSASEMPRRIKLCREALKMISKEKEPEIWAELQNDLACSLLKTPTGQPAENIEEALQHFDEALKVRTRQKYPTEWAIIQDNLGTAYRDRIHSDRAENIEKAIYHYEQALGVRTLQSDPKRWAMSQRNLGEVYRIRVRESRNENIKQSIQYLNQALLVFTREAFPDDWAILQQNLGAAYINRIGDVNAENIEQAIYHCKQALEIFNRKAYPEDWALLQHNLGIAHRLRIYGDRVENIEMSISYFRQALEVRTSQTFPEKWARTQSELGNTYLTRIRDEREKNVEQAIVHYLQALKVYTRQAFPEDWARVCNNLGNAYLARIDPERTGITEKTENVNLAILNYEQALKIRTKDSFPEDWAETQSNLAGAERIRGSVEDLEHAIHHLEPVLEIYTRDALPQQWARTHNNLAIIYADRKQGEPEENIKQAIGHYQLALEIYTLADFPKDCLETARGLGKLAFEKQQWELARDAYDIVLMAQDVLMHTSLSSASEKAELYEVQNLPPRAAYAHMKMGEVKRAVEVMEKGRAQLLRESFELQQQNLKRLIALRFENLYNDYIQARNEYQSLQNRKTFSDEPSLIWKQALEKMQAAASAIREKVGQKHPEYRYFLQSLSFDEIQEQAREKPLVYLCATSAGGFALVVTGQGVKVIEIPELDQEALQKQIWCPSNEEIDQINVHLQMGRIEMEDIQAVKGGFFSMYALLSLTSHITNMPKELKSKLFTAWQETLDETTQWLWNMVMGRLIPLLKEHGEAAVLIPAGQLVMLPLHAAWTGDTSKPTKRRYALDELNISYAPSVHALRQASLAAERPADKLMIVDNPDGSLYFLEDEVRAALDGFRQSKHLYGETATIKAVKEEMQNAHVLHFATHGFSEWQVPEHWEEEKQARLKLADGKLTLPEIFALDLHLARLAVLSACETGVPGFELVDEMLGLPAGMLQAGVPGVVGSLWSVSDRSTALLMARFYRFWRKEGKAPQEALRQAQIWLRDRLIKYKSPYYWAAFTYTGV